MKHPAIKRLIIVIFFSLFTLSEALGANSYYAKVTASVVNRSPTGMPVYGGTVMVQQHGEDQDYSTSSTGYNYTENYIWEPSTGGNPVPITMKAKANNGYSFSGWFNNADDNYPVSSNITYTDSFNTGTSQGVDNTTSYTIFAKFSPSTYYITYVKGDHSTGGSTATKQYNIENGFALQSNGFTPEAGWVFDKWKVTTAGSGSDGNWTLNSTYDEGQSIAAGKFGDVTLTALWKESPLADITIIVTGLEEGESAIFTVTRTDSETPITTVSITGNSSGTSSATIKSQQTGFQYQVRPINAWTWTYTMDPNGGMVIGLGKSGATFEFEATKKSSVKKNDEQVQVNWQP